MIINVAYYLAAAATLGCIMCGMFFTVSSEHLGGALGCLVGTVVGFALILILDHYRRDVGRG